jgi:hypothetical protein
MSWTGQRDPKEVEEIVGCLRVALFLCMQLITIALIIAWIMLGDWGSVWTTLN